MILFEDEVTELIEVIIYFQGLKNNSSYADSQRVNSQLKVRCIIVK